MIVLRFVVLSALLFSTLVVAASAVETVDIWERVGDRFLKFHSTPKTWVEATQVCLYEGGRLVIDDDQTIHDYLKIKANGNVM